MEAIMLYENKFAYLLINLTMLTIIATGCQDDNPVQNTPPLQIIKLLHLTRPI